MNRINYIKHVILSIVAVVSFGTHAVIFCSQNIVFSFDLDDVVSIKAKPGLWGFVSLSRAAFRNPTLLSMMWNYDDVRAKGKEFTKEYNGTTNIVHSLIEWLDKEGYGDLSYYEDEIIQKSVNPVPIMPMVENIRALKKQGYRIVSGTNQDYKQHQFYREEMKSRYDIDLNELFDAVLTTRVNHERVPSRCNVFYRLNMKDNIYVMCDREAYKPNVTYFEGIKALVRKVVPYHKKPGCIIHIDDKKENVMSARQAGLKGMHFKLAGGNARKTKSEDLQKTINTWKEQLKKYGVSLD